MSREALTHGKNKLSVKSKDVMQHQREMKEQFFQDLKNLENGTRDLMGEANVIAIYIRLIEELNEIDEIYTQHLKSLHSQGRGFGSNQDTLKTQEE